MLREGGRLIVMNAVVTTAWRYPFVDGLARPFTMFTLACLAVLAAPYVQGPARRLGGALLIGALVNYLLSPGVQVLHDHALQAIASLSHDKVYKVPYGWQVEVPSYITFIEPTIAAFILAAFVWDRLSPAPSGGCCNSRSS